MNNKFIRLCFIILLCWGCSNKPDKQETSDNQDINGSGNDNSDAAFKLDSNKVIVFLAKRNDLQEFTLSIFDFYKKRDFQPAWIRDSEVVPAAQVFLTKLQNAEEEGLNSAFYKSDKIKQLLQRVQSKDNVADSTMNDIELLLTAEFCKYAADVNSGATRAEKENLKWFVKNTTVDYTAVMTEIIKDKSKDPYLRLEPSHPEYHQLKILLKKYREFAQKGGWPQLSGFKRLKLGDVSDNVMKVRERLSITGEIRTPTANYYNPKVFDRALDEGVKTFQAAHGLRPDGIVGGTTLETMNRKLGDRINQIIVNMERWRLVPNSFTDRFIMVNVPEYRLYLYESGKAVIDMRIVAGEEFNSTPLFNDTLKYIVFSPYWNIPKNIAVKETLPEIYQDPSMLKRQGIEAVRLDGPTTATVVPFYSVPWNQYNKEENFRYFLRQKPGPKNPLGSVKFLFPNKHNIYLHDTPFGNLFDSEKRGYSHGCIRIEEPVKLAEYLLKASKPEWTKEQVQEAMKRESELHIRIGKPIPVFILYFTTWVDNTGMPQFRKDVYGYDELLSELLKGNSIKKLLEEKEARKAEWERQAIEKRQNEVREKLERERAIKEQKEREQQMQNPVQETEEDLPNPPEDKPEKDTTKKNFLERIFGGKKED